MTQLSDANLLDRFRADQDREALDALVRRYIDLVYSAAIRHVRDPHLAEDITQAVFIVLVRNARSIRTDAILPAWLFTVTRHAAANALRMRSRRQFHEMRKMQESSELSSTTDDAKLPELREHLDHAIARLPQSDRSGVLLHFFANQTHKQVGASLGISEEAARKRITRAVEKLRTILEHDSLDVRALTCDRAPASLLASTVNVALLANCAAPASASSTASLIAQGVSRMLVISKVKVAAAIAAAVLLTGGVAWPIVANAIRPTVPIIAPAIISTIVESATSPATAPSEPKIDLKNFSVALDDKTNVSFLCVSQFPPENDACWNLAGEPMDMPDLDLGDRHITAQPAPEHMIAIKLTRPKGLVVRVRAPGATTSAVMQMSHDDEDTTLVCAFSTIANGDNGAIELGISAGAWKTAVDNPKPGEEAVVDVAEIGDVTMHPIESTNGGSEVSVEHPQIDTPTQLVVVDIDGKEHASTNINVRSDGQSNTLTCKFDVPADRVKNVLYQTRPFSKYIDVTDISLEKGSITHPQIKVRDATEKR